MVRKVVRVFGDSSCRIFSVLIRVLHILVQPFRVRHISASLVETFRHQATVVLLVFELLPFKIMIAVIFCGVRIMITIKLMMLLILLGRLRILRALINRRYKV